MRVSMSSHCSREWGFYRNWLRPFARSILSYQNQKGSRQKFKDSSLFRVVNTYEKPASDPAIVHGVDQRFDYRRSDRL